MSVTKKFLLIIIALSTTLFADELAQLKTELANLQQAMGQLDLERAELRASSGGEPAKLTCAGGNAKLKIGGEIRTRYAMGWANGYGRTAQNGADKHANYKSQYAGWALQRAQMTFDFALSADTSARLALRFEGGSNGVFGGVGAANLINEAWWKWKNVGGTNFTLIAGYQYIPFGMANNFDTGAYSWASTANGIITVPFVLREEHSDITGRGVVGERILSVIDRDITTAGIVGEYRAWDNQLILKAGIFAPLSLQGTLVGRTTAQNNDGVNTANEIRNLGIVNQVVNISYNPAGVEGLHVEAAYIGQFDNGMGYNAVITDPYNPAIAAQYDTIGAHGEHTYRPSFDIGAYYKIGKWKFYGEMVLTPTPAARDGFGTALSLGTDYQITSRLMLSAEGDYLHYNTNSDKTAWHIGGKSPITAYDIYRATVGVKYDFANGLIFQAQYLHDFARAVGADDGAMKDNDAILFQSSYRF